MKHNYNDLNKSLACPINGLIRNAITGKMHDVIWQGTSINNAQSLRFVLCFVLWSGVEYYVEWTNANSKKFIR